jgi:uncharacterized protein
MTKTKLIQKKTNKIVVEDLKIANGILSRAIGLLGRKSVNPDFGIMFPKCRSIHTHFMRFSIDIIFVDDQNRITELFENLKPWKILIAKNKKSRHIIEVAAGSIEKSKLTIGSQLELNF